MAKDLMPQLLEAWNQEGTNQNYHRRAIRLSVIRRGTRRSHNLNSTSQDKNEFLERFEDVTRRIDTIAINNKEIKSLHHSIWVGVKHQQVEEDRNNLQRVVSETKSLGIEIRDILKKEQAEVDSRALEPDSTVADKNAITLQKAHIAAQSKRFLDQWTVFNELQVLFRDKSKEDIKKQYKIIQANITEEQIDVLLDEGSAVGFNISILESPDKAKQEIDELTKRRDQFLDLERAIEEIRDLFVELADLVRDQGDLVNNIEYNVGQANVNVEKGTRELGDALSYKNKTRKMKLICLIVLLIFIPIILLIIVGVQTSSPPYQTPSTEDVNDYNDIEPTIRPSIIDLE